MAKYSLILDKKSQVEEMVKYHVGEEEKAVKKIWNMSGIKSWNKQ